ncbi:MAG: response regulator [Acidobacteria bacterium]|nr:response regulator [Acidobacteriota bacterium]
MKILIIDDESDIRRIARLALNKVGKMDVVEASSGIEGIEKAEVEKPDVILLDVMMPSMDGPSTFAQLQNKNTTNQIPVIFLTAKALPSEINRLKALGVKGVLTKPFDPMILATQVKELLNK